jgi:hypothetical protein
LRSGIGGLIVSTLKIVRLALYVVLCVGIGLAVIWSPRSGPHDPFLPPSDYPYLPPPEGTDVLFMPLGLGCGFGMLAWCVAFRRVEPRLARFGWFAAAIGIFFALYLPPIT